VTSQAASSLASRSTAGIFSAIDEYKAITVIVNECVEVPLHERPIACSVTKTPFQIISRPASE